MVPNGWEIKKLNNVFKVFDSLHKTPTFSDDGYAMVRVTDIKGGYLDLNNTNKVSSEVFAEFTKKYKPKASDIVFSRVGSYGISSYAATDTPFCLGQNTVIAESNSSADSLYIFNVLKGQYVKRQIERTVDGSSHKTVSLKIIRSLDIPIPPLPEQRKIAKILSTWDKAISTTERLIDNSKQQKKALMQQLLTGKKRLLDDSGKPFEGEWEDKYLHDVARIIVSPVDKKTIEGEIPVELCNYTDVYYNTKITKSLTFMKATAKQSEIDKYTLKVNDVIVTKDSETPGDIAVPALVSEDLNGVVCGYHLAIIRPNNELVEGSFLNYLFSMPKTRYYFFTLATGATRFGLSVGGINKAHLTLPPLVEQQKIAALLTNTDKEIELLEQQLADLKQEKKALMQQLLTGKRRVKVDDKEVA
ncbi:restriction endonuclease subunit S [Paraglaciecola sp.]|uniref:restriction endonuclease subunit S n=1 Tax=Paraglaciecola sp. TaxID=1920173 RepID=UPI003EF5ADC9